MKKPSERPESKPGGPRLGDLSNREARSEHHPTLLSGRQLVCSQAPTASGYKVRLTRTISGSSGSVERVNLSA